MKIQTEVSYEALATALKIHEGLDIDLVEVDRLKGTLKLVLTGKVPSRAVTSGGFSPSGKRHGAEPDTIHISYLKREVRT